MNYLYIGLLTSSELGLIEVEQEKTNYRRIEMGPGDWFFLDGDIRNTITNAVEVRFPEATDTWGMITHFGVFDSLSNGNLLITGTLDNRNFIYKECKSEFKIGKIKIPIKDFSTLGVDDG